MTSRQPSTTAPATATALLVPLVRSLPSDGTNASRIRYASTPTAPMKASTTKPIRKRIGSMPK